MDISTTQHKRCDLVTVSGRVDSGSSPKLVETFNAIIEAGRFNIVFDMQDVEYVSSAGLRAMIDAQKTCKRWARGELVLCNVSPEAYEVLDLVGFVPLFRFCNDVTEAVGSF